MARPHILLVDTETGTLCRSAALLETAGFLVSIAESGREALNRLVTAAGHDLVLINPKQADIDGLQFIREVKQGGLDVGIIIVSDELSYRWVSSAFQLGASDYLSSACDDATLLSAINRALLKQETEKGYSHLRKQLERSEQRHRFMVESSPDIIFIIDRDGHFTFANERAEDMLGYRKEELAGEHFSMIMDSQSIPRAEACFHGRRSSSRPARIDEIWLLGKGNKADEGGRRRVAVELTAMGIFENESPDDHGGRWMGKCTGIYVVARDITERLASQKLIHYQAYHDLLTGLPNRALFLDRLGNAISIARRGEERLAVMFLDLDRFKIVNDSLGHDVGDALLKKVAERLSACLRESDTLARLGGDEFIVLLRQVDTLESAHTVAAKIVNAIKEPFVLMNNELYLTASVGISMYPEDGLQADTLIKHADIAMYHTKGQGKNGFHAFSLELSELQQRQLTVENDIRKGLRDQHFRVYYQPQVDIDDSRVTGVEALLRWQHPDKGLLAPGSFLTVAEDSGLIVELGEWILDTALEEFTSWLHDGLALDKLAINFSLREVERPDFVGWLTSRLKHHGMPGSRFEIEITESALMNDALKTAAKLRELSEYGISIAIDDFGTGYSSLSLLQKLPINRLKIDRSFIQDLHHDSDRSIIEAIAHMARGLKQTLVAEGVEQEFQLDFLNELDCKVIQGHIYSPSIPGKELKQLLASGLVLERKKPAAAAGKKARSRAKACVPGNNPSSP